jgi:nucleoside-diphosphate-sugar epimerase
MPPDEFNFLNEKGLSLFITGIDGFAGIHLSHLAKNCGFQVTGISRTKNKPQDGIYQCDIADEKRLRDLLLNIRPNLVAHLSAVSSFVSDDISLVYRTNLLGSRALLSALSKINPRPDRVLLISSGNVYQATSQSKLRENAPLSPITDYSISKIAMEFLRPWWEQFFPIVIARPFNHIGRGQSTSFLVPRLVAEFKKRSPVISVGNISTIRDFSDVRDTVKSYLSLLMISQLPGHPINVCTGVGHPISSVVEILQEFTQHIPNLEISRDLVRQNEIPYLVGDNSILREVGAHVPTENLRECLSWILSE